MEVGTTDVVLKTYEIVGRYTSVVGTLKITRILYLIPLSLLSLRTL